MIKVTRWKPDTCTCVIEYSWDTETPQDIREHVLSAMEACPIHVALGDAAAYEAVLAENRTKNQATGMVMEELAIPVEQVRFGYSPERKLQLTLLDVDNYAKTTLLAVLEEKFGKGSVELL
jgi:hypothetical protein